MKQIVKTFNNSIKKTIFKVLNKTNINFKISKLNIIKKFNKFSINKIFDSHNKTNSKHPISRFNKYLITIISLLFSYLFYLSIPILYDKNWVQTNIENQLFKDFKIHFSLSSDISYRILPSPHYLIENSKIFKEDNKVVSLAEIRTLKVFVSQKNFFNKEKMLLKYIKIADADFTLLSGDLELLKKSTNDKFSNKKIEINKSNIFFKDNLEEVIFIIKISKAFLFQDDENLLNLFKIKGDIFNIPFNLDYKKNLNPLKREEFNIVAKMLKLNIFNESSLKKNNDQVGNNIISFLNSEIDTNYKIENGIVIFNSNNSRIKTSKIDYSGELSINPFDLNLNIDVGNYDLRKFFKYNSFLNELIKTDLLFNDHISISTLIKANSNSNRKIFQKAKINFNIINGKLNIDKTRLTNEKIGFLELENSKLSLVSDDLILNTDIVVNIKNAKELFSLLQTNKKFKNEIKSALINLDYNFLSNEIKFNNIKIDNQEISDELLRIIDNFNDNELNNWNKSKRILNIFFEAYAG